MEAKPYASTIQAVNVLLQTVFDGLDQQFDLTPECLNYPPADGGWTILEILEHITLTSHFLMLVIRNGRDKVLKRSLTQSITGIESNLAMMDVIADPDAFAWARPEHMEPTRSKTPDEIRRTMRDQQQECLIILGQMKNGEGSLHQVRMSVQNLGKLDLYQWLYFLAQHARRHAVEIERIKAEYNRNARSR